MQELKYPIKKVVDNKAKGLSYRENIKRYNKAKASEFYLECLWILYAMIEDRTSSFLYYIGFTAEKKRTAVTGRKKIKQDIREILEMEQENAKYRFDTLSGKLTRIKSVLKWSEIEHDKKSSYQETLTKVLKPIAEIPELNDALTYIDNEWREKRNQLTHSLFNKDPEAVVAELLPLVENGYIAARQIDSAIRLIKKENIRERFNIP